MRIVCPNCQATYEVPAAVLGAAPRPVRCARCATEWTPPEFSTMPAPEPEASVPPPAPLADNPMPNLASAEADPPSAALVAAAEPVAPRLEGDVKYRPPRRSGVPVEVVAALALSLLLLVALGAAGYLWRDAVMRAWPPSARLFALLHR